MKSIRYSLLPAAVLLLAAAAPSQAAIIVVAPTATTAGSITITQDITVIVTVAGSAAFLAMDEWATSDGSATPATLSGAQKFVYSLNGAADKSGITDNILYDTIASSQGALTPNDGLLGFDNRTVGNSLAIGQTFTLRSGTFDLNPVANFTPLGTQTFTGNVFLITSGGVRLSANTPAEAVPEPGTVLLGALAGLTLLRRRGR